MRILIRKIFACVKKDLLNVLSYKFCYFLRLLNRLLAILFVLVAIYLISHFFEKRSFVFNLDGYKITYFLFGVSGIIFTSCFLPVLSFFSKSMEEERSLGTLEALLVTPSSFITITISKYISSFITVMMGAFLYFVIGIYYLKNNVVNANIFIIVTIFVLSFIPFVAVGLLLASFIISFEKGDAITKLIINIFRIFGGVFFPISFLPKGLQVFSYFLPITYSIKALRQVLFKGHTFVDIAPEIVILLFFSVILWPLSIFLLNRSIKRAKIKGTISCY